MSEEYDILIKDASIVDGVPVVERAKHTGARPGKILLHGDDLGPSSGNLIFWCSRAISFFFEYLRSYIDRIDLLADAFLDG